MRAWPAYVVTALCVASAAAAAIAAGQSGSAEISGMVVTTDLPPVPLPRVVVTISASELASSRTTVTDERGLFVFANLPAGSFTVTAARPPYVRTAFGARRPGRPGTPIALTAAQHLAGVTLALAQGAAISGLIRGPDGAPAPNVNVSAVSLDGRPGASTVSAVTDDRGVYRIYGLVPGRYVVNAAVAARATSGLTLPSEAEMDEILARLRTGPAGPAIANGSGKSGTAPVPARSRAGASVGTASYTYAPIYYPGTVDPDEAETVTVAAGEDRGNVDLDLQLVPVAAVQGSLSMPGGVVPAGTQVVLVRQPRPAAAGSNGQGTRVPTGPNPGRVVDPTGGFRFNDVLPGRYLVRAATGRGAGSPMWADAEITISGDDVSGLALVMQPAVRLSGRLVFEAHTATPPLDLTKISIALEDVAGQGSATSTQFSGRSGGGFTMQSNWAALGQGRPDGTFEINGIVPGTYRMAALTGDANWSLRSVVVDGHEFLDVPFEIRPGDVTGVVATLTDLHAVLSGTLQTATGIPAPEYVVVVFPSSRALWGAPSRRVQSTRPATDGRFAFRDLPAGDYLLAAVTDIEPADLADATFLEALVQGSASVHLADGETKTQNLGIRR